MNKNFNIQFLDSFTTKIVFGSKNRVIVIRAFEDVVDGIKYPSLSAFHVYFYSPDEDLCLHGFVNQSHYGLVNLAYNLYVGFLDSFGDRFNSIRKSWFLFTSRCVANYPNLPISVDEMKKFVESL